MGDTGIINSLPDDLYDRWLHVLADDIELEGMYRIRTGVTRVHNIEWLKYDMSESLDMCNDQREIFSQVYDHWAIQTIKKLIIEYGQEVLPGDN